METRDSRKFLRIQCETPICTQISIVKFNNKTVTTGKGNICVENISFGGLMFLFTLNLPVSDNMLIEFKLTINEGNTALYGYIVRKEEIDGGIFRYGVQFININDEEQQFISELNGLSEDGILKNCALCSGDMVDCIKKYNGKFNKRIYKRYNLNNNFRAKLKVDTFSNISRIDQWQTVLVDNISQNGIHFISDLEVPIDEETILEFKIVIGNIEIYVEGYAMWRIKDEDNKYKYGVEFHTHKFKREMIGKILDEVMDLTLEKGLLSQKCFSLKYNYANNEKDKVEWWV